MIKKCILTNVDLSEDNNSKAHIIPSSLGGNLKPKGILSKEANSILNDNFDIPLYRALSPFMALLGGVPDRGNEVVATKMESENGDSYYVKFGEKLKPTRPKLIKEEITEDKIKYKIEARTKKETRNLIAKIQKDHPDFFIDIEDIINNTKTENSPVEGMLRSELSIGPNVFFPSSFIMASLFATYKGLNPHPEFRSFVNGYNEESLETTIPPDTFYWVHTNNWLKTPDEISHIIALITDPERKKTFFYVELFNLLGVAVVMPFLGKEENVYTYGIDIIEGKEIEVDLKLDLFKSS